MPRKRAVSKSRLGCFIDALETRVLFDGTVLTQFTNFALGTVSPASAIAIDSNGNLFGTYSSSDATHNGGVWELKKPSTGYDPVAVSLAAFPSDGSMGRNTRVGVIMDSQGNLFGANDPYDTSSTTGELWKLPKTSTGYGTLQTVAMFQHPQQGVSGLLSIDSNNVILGQADQTGENGLTTSTIFRYSAANGFQTVLDYDSTNIGGMESNLVTDPLGNIFGSTINGGTELAGAIFELPVGENTPQIIASFARADSGPFGNISVITNGNNITMFGVTEGDELGNTNTGTLWELPVTAGSPGPLTNFVTFGSGDKTKAYPNTTFIGPDGNLYGGAEGQSGSDGFVWEATRSGDTFGEPASIAVLSTAETSAAPVGYIRQRWHKYFRRDGRHRNL